MNKKLVSCLITAVYSLNSLPVFAGPLIPISSGIRVLNDLSPGNISLPSRAAPAFSDERENHLDDAEQLLRQSLQNAEKFRWGTKRTKRTKQSPTDTCPSAECRLKDKKLYSDNIKDTVSGMRLISKEEIPSGSDSITVEGSFFGRNLFPGKFKEFSNVFGQESEKTLFLGKVNSKRETGHTTLLDLLDSIPNCLCVENQTLTLTKDLADMMEKRIGQNVDRFISTHQDKLINSDHTDENTFYGFATLMPKIPSSDAFGVTRSEFAYYKLNYSEFQRLTFGLSENFLAISHALNKTTKTALLTQKGCLLLATHESEPSTSRIVNIRTKFLRELFSTEGSPSISEERQCSFGNLSYIFPSYSPPLSPRDEDNTTGLNQSSAETANYVPYLTAAGITGAVVVIGSGIYRWMKNSHKQERNLSYDIAVYNNH
ncbi:MAG: hypothetical protein ACRCYP_04150 [Alphaproteobacteria bacterium]